jgi:hypothetical protein
MTDLAQYDKLVILKSTPFPIDECQKRGDDHPKQNNHEKILRSFHEVKLRVQIIAWFFICCLLMCEFRKLSS